MSTDKNDFVRGSSLLLTGRMISIVVNTAFQILLVRYLSQSDFGVIAFGLSVAALVQVVVSLGQERSISRFIVFYEEEGRSERVLGTMALYVLSVAMLGLISFFIVIAIGDTLVGGLDNDSAAMVVAILVLLAPLDSLDMMMQSTFAAFSQTRSIFVKKYLVNPLVKLAIVLLVIGTHQSVEFVAVALLAASATGVLVYWISLPKTLESRGILKRPLRQHIEIPVRDVLRFSLPLLSSPLVFITFMLGSVTVLAWHFDSVAVASYRAIWPAASLNLVVSSTFSMLFLPSLARLVVRGDPIEISAAYWRTSAWVAALTMPVLLVTLPLAHETTLLLFGERYASSASVLAVVTIGMYCDVVFGFNRQTLELYGRVWVVFCSDASTVVLHIALTLLLVPGHGPQGAAAATTLALIARNLVNQLAVSVLTPVTWFERRYVGIYIGVAASAALVGLSNWWLDPPIVLAYLSVIICTIVMFRLNRRQLHITETFPELNRIPLLGRLVA